MDSNLYAHPTRGIAHSLIECIANSPRIARVRRATVSRLPFPVLSSDVVNVVYATWLVDAARARSWAPPGAVLWETDGLTPFTILTYRHGHFGPRAAGSLRNLFPSPLQSNWRLYLKAPMPGAPDCPTVIFVKNIFDSPLYTLGTRLFSDALPSHLASRFSLSVQPDEVAVAIETGGGSSPSFSARFEWTQAEVLPAAFASFASTWRQAATRLAAQDAAVVRVPFIDRVAVATISLPVEIESLKPIHLRSESLHCPLLQELRAHEEPLCFLLPSVHFQALSERLL